MAMGFSADTVRIIIHKRLTFFFTSGSMYMWADHSTIYCIGETADLAIDRLNKAVDEFYKWCPNNRLMLHPRKSGVICMVTPMGFTATVYLGDSLLSLVTKKKLFGLIVDQKLTWVANVLETKKSLAKKVDLLKRSHFHKEHLEF